MLHYFWNRMRKRARGERGFTLIELVVVLAILGILIALAVPRYLGARRRSYAAEARNLLQEVKTLEWAYYQQYGTFVNFGPLGSGGSASPLGFTVPGNSLFSYQGSGGGSANVTLTATGNGVAGGIALTLVLSSDGSSTLTESF